MATPLTLSGSTRDSAAAQGRTGLSYGWLAGCGLAVLLIGALQAWDVRWPLDPDGVAYLDMGDAFIHGNWRLALNALWPPLYPALIGLTNWILRTPPRWEIVVLHGLNLLIYLAAYGACLLLIVQIMRHQAERAERASSTPAFGPKAWLLLGTAVFVWAALTLATIPEETPDMLAGVFIFLACACLVRIWRGCGGWGTFVLLGVVLSLAYQAKYFMFGMAFVFILVAAGAVAVAGTWRAALPRGLLAVAAFLLVSSPFIIGLSLVKGRLMVNNSGTDAYLYHVDAVPFVNWHGGPAGTGTLIHPTRVLNAAPLVYEYATPVAGTYPPWDDPDYWMAGSTAHFDIGGQLNILLQEAAPIYTNTFVISGGALLAGLLLLFALAGGWRENFQALAGQWVVLAPALAALGLFAIVHVETRYMVAFAAVLWIGLLSAVRPPAAPAFRPLVGRLALVMSVVTLLVAALPPALNTLDTAREWLRGRAPQAPDQWQVASALHKAGIPEQDKIAVMGNAFHDAAWARLARVQIVAEIPDDQADSFWALPPAGQTRVLELLAGSGADDLVARLVPSTAPAGWQPMGQTGYYVLRLR